MIIKRGRYTFLEKLTRRAEVCGLLFLDCAFQVLIGWASTELQSHGFFRGETRLGSSGNTCTVSYRFFLVLVERAIRLANKNFPILTDLWCHLQEPENDVKYNNYNNYNNNYYYNYNYNNNLHLSTTGS